MVVWILHRQGMAASARAYDCIADLCTDDADWRALCVGGEPVLRDCADLPGDFGAPGVVGESLHDHVGCVSEIGSSFSDWNWRGAARGGGGRFSCRGARVMTGA